MKRLQTPLEIRAGVSNTVVMTKNSNAAARHPARRGAGPLSDSPGRGTQPVHRVRQARARLEPRPLPARFAHLRRTYD